MEQNGWLEFFRNPREAAEARMRALASKATVRKARAKAELEFRSEEVAANWRGWRKRLDELSQFDRSQLEAHIPPHWQAGVRYAHGIILLGAVAGGGDPAAVTAALDNRVCATVPFNFGRTAPGWGSWESTRDLPRSIVDGFFPWVITSSVAPRRLVYAVEMSWEHHKSDEPWRRLEKIFGFYGAPDQIDRAHGYGTFPGPGECTNIGAAQRKTLYPELKRWFGIPMPEEEPDDRRPEEELASLTPRLAAEIGMRDVHELAHEAATRKLDAARKELARLGPQARRERLLSSLTAKLGDIEPNRSPQATLHGTREWKQAEVEALTLQVEPGIIVPLLLLKPKSSPGVRPPVVVAVAQGGKERVLSQHITEIELLLAAGTAVCLPDVRGVGETSPDPKRGPGSRQITLAATEFMLGNTLLGARLKDLRTVLAHLRTRTDLDAKRIALWGDSAAPPNPDRLLLDEVPGLQTGPVIQRQAEPMGGLLALLGAAYDEDVRAVAVRRTLVGFLSVLDDNFAYVPLDVIVPGILEAGDVADIAASVAPRPMLLGSLVDGRNRIVPDADLRSRLSLLDEAYRSISGRLLIRSGEQAPGVAKWLLANF